MSESNDVFNSCTRFDRNRLISINAICCTFSRGLAKELRNCHCNEKFRFFLGQTPHSVPTFTLVTFWIIFCLLHYFSTFIASHGFRALRPLTPQVRKLLFITVLKLNYRTILQGYLAGHLIFLTKLSRILSKNVISPYLQLIEGVSSKGRGRESSLRTTSCSKPVPQRSRIDIMACILENSNESRKKSLMKRCDLSLSQFNMYEECLVKAGLLRVSRRERGVEILDTTEKGREFLVDYQKIKIILTGTIF